MIRRALTVVCVLGLGVAPACGGDGPRGDAPGDLDAGADAGSAGRSPDAAPLAIAWAPCALDTPRAEPAECARVVVPYRWDAATDRATLELAVKRYRRDPGRARGQIWLLQGGPGASVRAFDGLAPYLAAPGVDLDVYLLDQRGTGGSSRLGCPSAEAPGTPGGYAIAPEEWPACVAAMQARWDARLSGFTMTATAHDLAALIDATRDANAPVFLYGVSYATALLNRYLQLYPTQPSGVVLDSICGAECDVAAADTHFDDVAREYFAACGADRSCAARLGPDPWARFGEVLDRLDGGHCPVAHDAGLSRVALRRMTATWLYRWDQRVLALALVHRLDRCGPQDAPVLQRLGQLFAAAGGAASVRDTSPALAAHVSLSEFWPEPSPSLDELTQRDARARVSNGVGPRLGALAPTWPRAPADPRRGAYARTSVPMLLLSGELDPATPIAGARRAAAAFTGSHQHFVALPRVPHSVIDNSPIAGDPTALPCGWQLVTAFLREPTAPLDTGCASRVAPLAFEASAAAKGYFDTADVWGD